MRNLVVRAPVDGIVQELAVTSAGQSVGSNQPLLKLVPTEGGLVIEARVENQDIGYVRLGQPVKVKIQAYDFLRYGTLGGTVERIAADAVVDPQDGKLGYGITVRTDGAALGDGALRFSVAPGMAVEVELLVGGRTILSYLTDRIFRLQELRPTFPAAEKVRAAMRCGPADGSPLAGRDGVGVACSSGLADAALPRAAHLQHLEAVLVLADHEAALGEALAFAQRRQGALGRWQSSPSRVLSR